MTRSLDGLPELTTRRNPNPSILKLFYGSNTMLRENEYIDSHKFTKEGNLHIYTLVLWKKEKELGSN